MKPFLKNEINETDICVCDGYAASCKEISFSAHIFWIAIHKISMKCILRLILYLSLTSFLSCAPKPLDSKPNTEDSSGVVSQPNILRNFDPRLISTLQAEQERSVKLNDLIKDMENSSFYINDHIMFSEEPIKENKDVTLNIYTQCIESETHKKFTKNTTMKYKNEIMLIELIPEELFSYGSSWWLNKDSNNPTCSFHFKAQNKVEDIHYFELPHLPILSFDNSLNLSLIQQQAPVNNIERVEHFPILNFSQIEDYAVISGRETEVDQLKLICETFSLSFDVDNLIHYDLWKLQGWTSILREDRVNQSCRFVSFNKKHIVGVSQLFPIVFPKKELTVEIITDTVEIAALKDKHPLSVDGYDFNGINQIKSDLKKDKNLGTYHNLAVLKLENKSIDKVHLYIPQTNFYTDTHFFYDNFLHGVYVEHVNTVAIMDDQGAFVTMKSSAEFILTPSLIKAKEHNMEINDKGYHAVYQDSHALFTLEAGSTAFIPLSINVKKQCKFRNRWVGEPRRLKFIKNIGMIFEGNIFPIYQVLDATDVNSAEKTIIGTATNNPHENLASSFRLDISLNAEKQLKNKHFYKNTCLAMATSKFDHASVVHQGTWTASTNKTGRRIKFTKDHEYSLSDGQSYFIREGLQKMNEQIMLERKNRRLNRKN